MKPRPLHQGDYAVLVHLVREIRLEAGLTQAQLAEKLGVDQSLISKVERRARRLDVAELRTLCLVLGVDLATFVVRFEAASSA